MNKTHYSSLFLIILICFSHIGNISATIKATKKMKHNTLDATHDDSSDHNDESHSNEKATHDDSSDDSHESHSNEDDSNDSDDDVHVQLVSKDENTPLTPEEEYNQGIELIKNLEHALEQYREKLSQIKDANERELYQEQIETIQERINVLKDKFDYIVEVHTLEEKQVALSVENAEATKESQAEVEAKAEAVAQQIKHSTTLIEKTGTFLKGDKLDNASTGVGLASTCISSFLSVIPPNFCYKKGGDAGYIPTKCPDGYFRSLALCYQNCKDDYKFVAGVCWQTCPRRYKDHGLTCYKKFWKWFWKKSYIPGSLTNFSSKIPCNSNNHYKSGALCYKDCKQLGMVNCGIGACAATSGSCAATISTMAVTFIAGMVSAVAFVASFGTASAATTTGMAALKQGLATMKNVAKQSLTMLKRIATDAVLRKALMKSAIEAAKKKAIEIGIETAVSTTVSTVCSTVGEGILNQISNKDDVNIADYDFTGIANAVSSCDNTSTDNAKVACAASILNVISLVDPTGLTSMASALMQDTCSLS